MLHSLFPSLRPLVLFAALAQISATALAQEISLFNGKDLAGWEGLPEFWSVKNGAITGQVTAAKPLPGNTFLVWKGGNVTDFDFTCKFKLSPDNPGRRANSGVQFRARPTPGFGLKGYQGEMDDGPLANNACLTDDPPGTKLAMPDAKAIASYHGRNWNDYRIVATGNHFQIYINGLLAVDTVDAQNRFTTGQLGLQLHKGSGTYSVQFKDLKLRPLAAGSSPSNVATAPGAPTSAPTTTGSDQSRIDVLKDQAPNASAWVLAPLDQTVPPDIRQNLTFLLEDLLDESAHKPIANAGAYKAGEQLCRTMIAALDERKQVLANAGYRAAEANARTGVTSQALEARRNYKMSWPQYAREESQRAELKGQAANNAEVLKERPKLEWAQRTAVLQKNLDVLYTQYREALRQPAASK